jgi:hypothetical protein
MYPLQEGSKHMKDYEHYINEMSVETKELVAIACLSLEDAMHCAEIHAEMPTAVYIARIIRDLRDHVQNNIRVT